MESWRENIIWIEQVNNALSVLARETNVQKALDYLLEQITYYLEVDCIICVFNTKEGETIELQCVTTESYSREKEKSELKYHYEKVVTDQANSSSAYILTRDEDDGSILIKVRYSEYASMLTLPIEDNPSRPMFLVFMSRELKVFDYADIQPCLAITRNLRRIFKELFSLPYLSISSTIFEKQRTSYELIKMCKTLSNTLLILEQVAKINTTVLITGETGTGKELVAESIHYLSTRKNKPYIKINCGAIPENLFESQFFGHEKGSFTGAYDFKTGYFEQANEGTLLLDEVGEIPLSLQVKLLRAIEYNEIQRIGSTKFIRVNVRIIASTNRNLEQMVKEKLFRQDLYYRLSAFPIHIAPLRERKMDIPVLVSYFLRSLSQKLEINPQAEISEPVFEQIMKHNWPGNIRELMHKLEQAIILSMINNTQKITQLNISEPEKKLSLENYLAQDQILTLNEVNRLYIEHILNKTKYVLYGEEGAAKLLDIHPNTLRSRMEVLGIKLKNKNKEK